jgi:hypothetical protein
MNFANLEIKLSGKFLKIESGQPHDIRVLSEEPAEKMQHFDEKTNKSMICGGPNCTYCISGLPISQRFRVNVYDHNAQKVLLWEFGTMIAKQIKSVAITLAEEHKILLDVDLKIEASGSNKSKKYMVTPRLTSKEIPKGLKLHSLEDPDLPF